LWVKTREASKARLRLFANRYAALLDNETLTENSNKYTDRLLQAFPATLKNDVLVVMSVLPLTETNIKLSDNNFYNVDNLIHESTYTVDLNGEKLVIPDRLYFNEPTSDKEASLSEIQKVILNCIYLRHHNGYLRQRRLEKLNGSFDYFIIPFTLQLLGEYVIQILATLDKQICDKDIIMYKAFVNENPLFWRRTQKRMVSYWNEYYRRPDHKKLKDYIGTRIVQRIKKATA